MDKVLTLVNALFTALSVLAALAAAACSARRKKAAVAPETVAQANRQGTLDHEKGQGALLWAIFLLALGIRLWKFGEIPGGVNQDGAMAAVDGKALADYGTDRFGTHMPAHLYAWGFGQMSSLLSYLIAGFVKLGGLNAVTMRLPQLLVSMAGLSFFYLLMKELFGEKTGLAAAAFAAINPWHFVQSRWALDCNLLPHFFVAALYFLARALRGGRLGADGESRRLCAERLCLYAAMLCFGLCMYCYGISLYTIPPLLFVLAAYCVAKKRLRLPDVLACAAVYLVVAWPFLLTMVVNFFKWETIELPFVTIQYFPDSIRAESILFFSKEPLRQLGANINALFDTTLRQKADLPWNEVSGFGTMYRCSTPFILLGIYEWIRTGEKNKFIALAMLLTGVAAGLLTNNVNINRVNLIYYGLIAFAVLGMRLTARELRFMRGGCLGMYALMAALLLSSYFGGYAERVKGYFYDGFGEALLCAEESGAEILYITADTQYTGSANVSEILTLFYDETDAAYFQGKTEENRGQRLLPYEERFRYVSFSEMLAEKAYEEGAACVLRAGDAEKFNAEHFTLIRFGDYCAAIRTEK